MLKVRLVRSRGAKGNTGSTGALGRGGRMLGEIEEYFIEGLVVGDTFVFGGEVVRYEQLAEDVVYVSRANDKDAKVPSYMGGKFPLSTYLAERVRKLLADQRAWNALPDQVRDWLSLQAHLSRVPGVRELVVETFPRADKHYLVCYPFEGRLAHQTLGMLLTRRLERARARPLGFVANEYALAVWGLGDVSSMIRHGRLDLNALFDPDMLGDDLEAWLAESASDETHLPHLRDHLRPDRAALHRRRKNPAAGAVLDRLDLRRAAQAPAGSRVAARGTRRCRDRAARYSPAQ